MPEELRNFERQYRGGTTLSAQLAVMPDRRYGIGFRVENFGASAEDGALKIQSKVGITYYGIEMVGRYLTEHWGRSHLYTHAGLGAIGYKENFVLNNDTYQATGTGFGIRLGLGAQFSPVRHLAVHAGIESLFGGVPLTLSSSSSSAYTSSQDTPVENITRVGAVVGLTFSL